MGKLVLHLPDGSTRDIVLARERMTIGRRMDNDICLPLPTVSAEHAAVVTVLDDSFLEDLRSRNGTLVNGKTITKHFLRDHDEIDIGRQRLVYYSGDFMPDEPAAAPMPAVRAQPASGSVWSSSPSPEAAVEAAARVKAAAQSPAANPRDAMIDTSTLFDPPQEPERLSAPTLAVLDGPSEGIVAAIDGDEFVLGRLGGQLATIRRTPDGYRLTMLEGDVRARINGAELPDEGALLALGDEIEVAGTRLRYEPAV
ncbi:MAG TPA: FHA domain-containing protein [Casimicrobiaceae bacterium]